MESSRPAQAAQCCGSISQNNDKQKALLNYWKLSTWPESFKYLPGITMEPKLYEQLNHITIF